MPTLNLIPRPLVSVSEVVPSSYFATACSRPRTDRSARQSPLATSVWPISCRRCISRSTRCVDRGARWLGPEAEVAGHFFADGAWLRCAVLAYNLIRWTTTLGNPRPPRELVVARSVRTQLIAVPGRLVNRSGTPTLRGPRDWPWAQLFTRSLARLRNLQPVPI